MRVFLVARLVLYLAGGTHYSPCTSSDPATLNLSCRRTFCDTVKELKQTFRIERKQLFDSVDINLCYVT